MIIYSIECRQTSGVTAEYPAILKLHLTGGWIRRYAVENTTHLPK